MRRGKHNTTTHTTHNNTQQHNTQQQPQQPGSDRLRVDGFCTVDRLFMAGPSWRPLAGGVAQRRRERRLRSWYRHEQQTVRMAFAAYTHHSALRRPTMARAGEWERAALHGHVPEHHPPQAAGTEYFSLDVVDVPAAGSRPDRLAGVRP